MEEQALRKRRSTWGSRMGLDQMESNGLQEVMVCIMVEDMDYVEWLEERPKGAQLKVNEVIDVSIHIRSTYVG